MVNGIPSLPRPVNEPVLSYAPSSPERAELQTKLQEMMDNPVEVPILIGGKEVTSGTLVEMRCPHKHDQLLGSFHQANAFHAAEAIQAAMNARADWMKMDWSARASILLKAADLLATKYRATLNAATMLCMSKTVYQAEIDSAGELIDFWRFNPYYMQQIYTDQPASSRGVLNYLEYRPLDGFVFAVTPFNFTSIAGNLPTSPALMGNTVVWKPASSAVLPAYYLMKVLTEAGLPAGVINMIPGPGPIIGPPVLDHLDLAGIHFTGSTKTFSTMWLAVGSDIRKYKSYPRIVGETGGKDFIFAHPSADVPALGTALVRGAFEYQGQKCSAASRAYIPDSLWPELKERMLADIAGIKMGDVADFTTFMGAVIDEAAFANISGYIEYAKSKTSDGFDLVCGGGCDKSEGFFIEPTIIRSHDPKSKLMTEEIFGPVLTVYVYPEAEYEQTLHLCDETSPYALTGALFAQDRDAVELALDVLRHAAGNFYINDKPTGAVVGQQPFGGSRASGTNDKAGSLWNLIRWTSPRAIKENFLPPTDFKYPHMTADAE